MRQQSSRTYLCSVTHILLLSRVSPFSVKGKATSEPITPSIVSRRRLAGCVLCSIKTRLNDQLFCCRRVMQDALVLVHTRSLSSSHVLQLTRVPSRSASLDETLSLLLHLLLWAQASQSQEGKVCLAVFGERGAKKAPSGAASHC